MYQTSGLKHDPPEGQSRVIGVLTVMALMFGLFYLLAKLGVI